MRCCIDVGALAMSDADAASSAAAQLNVDAHLNTLEKRYMDVKRELDKTKGCLAGREKELKSTQEELSATKGALSTLGNSNKTLQNSLNQFNSSSIDSSERFDRAVVEQDRLRAEIDRLSDQMSKTSDLLSKAREDLAVSDSSKVPLQYEIERLKKEKVVVNKHTNYLDQELSKALHDLSQAKKQSNQTIIDLKVSACACYIYIHV